MSDTIHIGGAIVRRATWTGETWIASGPVATWPAPSFAVAQRWADEVTARGGSAQAVHGMDGMGGRQARVDVWRLGRHN